MDAGTKLFTNTHSKELLFSTNSPFSKGVNILQESITELGQEMFFLRFGRKTEKNTSFSNYYYLPTFPKNGLI